jgi:hypothetical protein
MLRQPERISVQLFFLGWPEFVQHVHFLMLKVFRLLHFLWQLQIPFFDFAELVIFHQKRLLDILFFEFMHLSQACFCCQVCSECLIFFDYSSVPFQALDVQLFGRMHILSPLLFPNQHL